MTRKYAVDKDCVSLLRTDQEQPRLSVHPPLWNIAFRTMGVSLQRPELLLLLTFYVGCGQLRQTPRQCITSMSLQVG